MEPVYGTVIQLARLIWRIQGLKITVTGVENLPKSGGAVIAINHTGYLDFTFAGLPAYQQGLGRKVRFMAKQEVFDHKITGPIMRSLRHISVNRQDGAASYEEAVRNLKDGELVGVYPEATISRSFEIKEFKSGAARMAVEAGVPIVPRDRLGRAADLDQGPPQEAVPPEGADHGARRRTDRTDAGHGGTERPAALTDAAFAGTGARTVRTPSGR